MVAGGNAARLAEAEIVAAWKGQEKVEHGVRLGNQRFVVPPLLLKTPQRIAALGLLIMGGARGAGRSERQVPRALAALQQPLKGLRPAGRAPLHPTVARLGKAFADDSLGQVKEVCGRGVESRVARLYPVQAHLLERLGLPQPAALCAQPVRG